MAKTTKKDPKRVKAGKKSRSKGKRGERKIVNLMNIWSSIKNGTEDSFRRWWAGREETGRKGDLKCPSWFPFVVEIRAREGWTFSSIFSGGVNCTIIKWWHEMLEKNNHAPLLLVFTKNRQPDYVMFSLVERSDIENRFGPIINGCFPVMRIDIGRQESLFITKLSDLLGFMDPAGFMQTTLKANDLGVEQI